MSKEIFKGLGFSEELLSCVENWELRNPILNEKIEVEVNLFNNIAPAPLSTPININGQNDSATGEVFVSTT